MIRHFVIATVLVGVNSAGIGIHPVVAQTPHTHQHGFSGAHGEGEDVTRVFECQGFANRFEPVHPHEFVVRADAVEEALYTARVERRGEHTGITKSESGQELRRLRKQLSIEIDDTWCAANEPQVPVSLECAELRKTEVPDVPIL